MASSSRRRAGLALRMAGPLLEVACLLALFNLPDGRASVAGVPARELLYAGMAAGLAMVVAGLILSTAGRTRS